MPPKSKSTTDFFLHVPRSGGSSLRTLLALNYPVEASYAFSGDPKEYTWFLSLPEEHRGRYRLLHGHFPFGLHAGLKDFRYFTLIRDPIKRHFSEFFYAQKYQDHHAHENIQRGSITLEWWSEIGEHHANYFNNTLCQFLSGDFQISKPTYATFQAACGNLERMQAFGLTERFSESALMMAKQLDWENPVYGKRNVVMGISKVPQELQDRARSFLQWDIALYAFATELFEKRLQEEARLIFPALESYRKKVEAAAEGLESEEKPFLVEDPLEPSLVEANRLEASSPILEYLRSPKPPQESSFRKLPTEPVLHRMKVTEASRYFISLEVYQETWVRIWWLGLIDVRDFPRVYHKVFGFFTCEERDDKGRFRFRFEDPRVGFVKTDQWRFPFMEDVESGQLKRFIRYKLPKVRFEVMKNDSWELVEYPFRPRNVHSPDFEVNQVEY